MNESSCLGNFLSYRYLSLRWDSPAPSFPSSSILCSAWPLHLLALKRQLRHLVYFPLWLSWELLGPFVSLINICKNPGFSVSLCFHVLFSTFLAELIWHKYLCVRRCSPGPQCLPLCTLLCGAMGCPSVVSLCVLWSTVAINVILGCGRENNVWYAISTLQAPRCQTLGIWGCQRFPGAKVELVSSLSLPL